LLSPLENVLGPTPALLLTAANFGVQHCYGMPYGVLGVVMSATVCSCAILGPAAIKMTASGRLMMGKLIMAVGGLLMLAGLVWFLQGVGILPGSFMSGQAQWAIYGALSVLVGMGLIVAGHRRARRPPA
jgi:hypothetical protein